MIHFPEVMLRAVQLYVYKDRLMYSDGVSELKCISVQNYKYGVMCVTAAAAKSTAENSTHPLHMGLILGMLLLLLVMVAVVLVTVYIYHHPSSAAGLFFIEVRV